MHRMVLGRSRLPSGSLGWTRRSGAQTRIGESGGMKILVVDDHPLIREALPQVLRALDTSLELLQAASCAEAVERTRHNPDVSLILLDLALPGVDGFEALRQLREEFPAIPVVVLSAYEQPDTVMRALDGGAMGFIPKTSSTA